ncbi:NAD(P)-binding protein [Lindgomyces ingoldianus]|uniref:NAD(P)-binding protein n=1 Tax=Lindgomyces ingoldianus TaxID=673940 RepID=A0ACB6RCG0_9PLEO|nr:NAD(P)-binding protein [Lindgomyces ingoldianus]KAF2476151.1 NAD(P)-binding protein [Lindgomyces ingoldianus]
MSKAILITGATGKQGGSLVNALLKANADFEILALTRNIQSPSAQKLRQKSPKIKLVAGNLDAVDEVFQKANEASKLPIWGVFSVQGVNAESEKRQGKALIDESIKNGVSRFVYSSADRGGSKSDTDPTSVPHFMSKFEIEQYLFKKAKDSGLNWTVLRPVAFFENLTPDFFGKVFATSFEMSLKKEQTLQMIATSDIGFFAAEAFLKPEEYQNKSITLAGDELTYDQFKTVFEKETGQTLPTTYKFIVSIIHWMVKDLGIMFKWFHDVGFRAEIPSLRKVNPEMKDFASWLKKESQFKTR